MLALLATFYQLYLQRVHNEKSLRPLGQIYFWDRNKNISVRVINNGLGPLIIDRITFRKSDTIYSNLEECLELDKKSYMHASLNDSIQRVILPNAHLTIFESEFEADEGEVEMNCARKQLSLITMKVEGRDVYDRGITLERDFNWFSRYTLENSP